MKILKLIGFVVLFECIFICNIQASNIMMSNTQVNQMQTQKKTMILNHLENNDLISSEIKKLGDKKEDVLCLALNMYHEARGSTIEDQIATTYVVFNRLEDKNYPLFYPKNEKSICNIVFDRYQFCWTNDEYIKKPKEIMVWNKIQKLAYELYNNPVHKKLAKDFEMKHYVLSSMITMEQKPKWINNRTIDVSIGKHSYMILKNKNIKSKTEYQSIIKKALIEIKKRLNE